MPPLTFLIIAATVYLSWRGFQHPAFLNRWIFEPRRILQHGEVHRIVTSGFLHADWAHLLFNMFSLYSFGGHVEAVYGFPTLLVIYLSAIIGGSLLSLWIHRNEPYLALGASGGVCGVIFAAIFLVPGGSVIIFPLPIPIPPSVFAVLFILVSFFGIKTRMGNIGHDAHLGGAVIGLLVATALHPGILRVNPILYTLIMGLSTALFLFMTQRREH